LIATNLFFFVASLTGALSPVHSRDPQHESSTLCC
jgi:hypothetical protein